MSWLSDIFAGGAKGVLDGVGGLAKDLRVAFTGDDPLTAEQKAALLQKAAQLEEAAQLAAASFDTAQMQGQIRLLEIDQASGSLFKGGWRPAVGWLCAFGLGYTFLLQPLLPWIIATAGVAGVAPLPSLPTETLMTLLVGMLGLGGMRSFEKTRVKG